MYRQKYDLNLKMASPGHKDAKLGGPEVKSGGHGPTNGPPVLTASLQEHKYTMKISVSITCLTCRQPNHLCYCYGNNK